MTKIHEKQIQSVIIEGGSFVLQQFIDADLWDETIIIKNKNLQLRNGTKAPKFKQVLFNTEDFRDNCIEFYRNSKLEN